MFKKKLSRTINNLLSNLGLKIVNLNSIGPLDLISKNIDPITAQYLFGLNQVIVEMKFAECRTNRWFDMFENSLDPGIFATMKAIKKNLKGKVLLDDIYLTLKEYKSLIGINNAQDFLDIEPTENNILNSYPWWAAVNPWDNRTFDYMLKFHPIEVKKDRLKNGMKILSNDPYEIMEENEQRSLKSHAKQYAKLTEEIKEKGFKYGNDFGYVLAELFILNNEFRWKIGGEGNHRAAVAVALGIKKIPVVVNKIIRLDEIQYWPNVANGIFTKDQATKIFNNIFFAQPSKINYKWIKKNS